MEWEDYHSPKEQQAVRELSEMILSLVTQVAQQSYRTIGADALVESVGHAHGVLLNVLVKEYEKGNKIEKLKLIYQGMLYDSVRMLEEELSPQEIEGVKMKKSAEDYEVDLGELIYDSLPLDWKNWDCSTILGGVHRVYANILYTFVKDKEEAEKMLLRFPGDIYDKYEDIVQIVNQMQKEKGERIKELLKFYTLEELEEMEDT